MNCEIDPIIEQAIVAMAQRDDLSLGLSTIGLVRYAIEKMIDDAGADNTRE